MLPVVGLLLFFGETYHSHAVQRKWNHSARYFVWGRGPHAFDRNPTVIPIPTDAPCSVGRSPSDLSCELWEPPGFDRTAKIVVVTGLPAFLVAVELVEGLGYWGINQVTTFLILTPILLGIWYWFIGWLIDRRRLRKTVQADG